MVFAFVCHVVSAVYDRTDASRGRTGYWDLYSATFIVALGNGTVEAVTNPVVATLFPREKTKWLNRLHAGWPGGLVLGGILGPAHGRRRWKYKVALLFLAGRRLRRSDVRSALPGQRAGRGGRLLQGDAPGGRDPRRDLIVVGLIVRRGRGQSCRALDQITDPAPRLGRPCRRGLRALCPLARPAAVHRPAADHGPAGDDRTGDR